GRSGSAASPHRGGGGRRRGPEGGPASRAERRSSRATSRRGSTCGPSIGQGYAARQMCYRLLAAVDPPIAPAQWRALATAHGLDLRVDESAPEVRFAEIATGDCACSLYTRREGRLR